MCSLVNQLDPMQSPTERDEVKKKKVTEPDDGDDNNRPRLMLLVYSNSRLDVVRSD